MLRRLDSIEHEFMTFAERDHDVGPVVAPSGDQGAAPLGRLLSPVASLFDNCVIRLSAIKTLELLCVESNSLNFLPCMLRI